jgi:hypothetical protein
MVVWCPICAMYGIHACGSHSACLCCAVQASLGSDSDDEAGPSRGGALASTSLNVSTPRHIAAITQHLQALQHSIQDLEPST